ncbi:hypothetical protein A5N14_17510 [Arthrobacter sp. M5]|nr:hypothetical protein [Arthrobacter sp. M5]
MKYEVFLVCFDVLVVGLLIWHARRDRKHRRVRPPTSGRAPVPAGPVFKDPSSKSHTPTPYSGWP